MISAGHIERASESESSDYENCSSSDDSLGTDVRHLHITHAIYAIIDFAKNVDSLLHTMAISSQTADRPRPTTTDCQQWFVETLFLRI